MPSTSTQFKNIYTSSDLSRLKLFLNRSLDHAGINYNQKSLQLLNLACGRADETAVLSEVFGKHTDEIHHTGIDIRAREIDTASSRWKNFQPHIKTEFLVEDASKLSHSQELSSNFDIAFMRHQNFVNGDVKWSKIYDEALNRLHENGSLIITSYFDHEHAMAIQAIKNLGAKLIHTQQNKYSRPLSDAPNKSVDKHVAIFKI